MSRGILPPPSQQQHPQSMQPQQHQRSRPQSQPPSQSRSQSPPHEDSDRNQTRQDLDSGKEQRAAGFHGDGNHNTLQALHTMSDEKGNGIHKSDHHLLKLKNEVKPSNNYNLNTEPVLKQDCPMFQDDIHVLSRAVNPTQKVLDTSTDAKKKISLAYLILKPFAIFFLILFEFLLIYSVFKNPMNSSYQGNESNGFLTIMFEEIQTDVVSSIEFMKKKLRAFVQPIATGNTLESSSIDNFKRRVSLGKQLLRTRDDATGSDAVCSSVAHAIIQPKVDEGSQGNEFSLRFRDEASEGSIASQHGDDAPSPFLSSFSLLNAEENKILSEALVCMGEARLSLYSSSFSSSSAVGVDEIKKELLVHARESFEASTSLDPTNPSARADLGLTLLLLGTKHGSKTSADSDDSLQYIFKSIQHLKAAVGLAKDAESLLMMEDEVNQKERNDFFLIQMASFHNLGLAYLALDGINSDSMTVDKATLFLDWASSLHQAESPHLLTDSLTFLTNKGSILLQFGKVEEALLVMEPVAIDACGVDDQHDVPDTSDSSQWSNLSSNNRRKELCSVLHSNLVVAREILSGKDAKVRDEFLLGERPGTHIDVDEWNSRSSNVDIAAEQSSPERNKEPTKREKSLSADKIFASDNNTTTTSDKMINATFECNEMEENETRIEEDEYSIVETQMFIPKPAEAGERNDDEYSSTERTISTVEVKPTSDGLELSSTPWGLQDFATKKLKPEMENALAALEKAADGRTRNARLLLALAKARSSVGDVSGAIDSALNAISASSSEEERETSTSYLESLMEKLASEEDSHKTTPPAMENTVQTSQNPDFVSGRDFEVSELQLKLEIEKLKYKVLEQEMRWGHLQSGPTLAENSRSIDYKEFNGASGNNLSSRQKFNTDAVEVDSQTAIISRDIKNPEILVKPSVEDEPEHIMALNHTQNEDDEEGQVPGTAANISDPINDVLSQNETDLEHLERESLESFSAVDERLENLTAQDNNTTHEKEDQTINITEIEPIVLPSLFNPELKPPSEIPPTAKSYMKLADAYLDKGKYSLASKQFLKVIKKAPDHLPALLGYATAIERAGKNKQINDAALAYGNATRVAIVQGEKVDPLSKAGGGGLAENILRRAVQIAKKSSSGKVDTLRALSTHAHTAVLAADIYYSIGLEISKEGLEKGKNKEDATQSFLIANEFIVKRNDTESPFHALSIIELGKIALETEKDAKSANEYFNKAKSLHLEDDDHVKMLALSGRAHMLERDLNAAISDFTRALSFPQCSSTASAHHGLAIALKQNNGDVHEINLHFEKALDMGMDPTAEAIEALGEHNISVMRSYNRQHWRSFNDGNSASSGGGVMGGGGVGSNKSVFAPHATQSEQTSSQAETLSILEQGAAAYDGHVPMGGEVEGTESNLSNLSGRKRN